MTFLEDGTTLQILDGIACALLAAAASSRSRLLGAHLTGAIVLGCLAGLMGPLLREAFLHGAPGTSYIVRQFPADALVGALGACAAMMMVKMRVAALFFWLDAASMALATSLGSLLSLPELGLVGGLSLGLVNGLAPGLIRDVALGDTALLVDRDWYATAAALGGVATLGVFFWLHLGRLTEWTASHAEITAVISGCLVCLLVRYWRWRKPEDI